MSDFTTTTLGRLGLPVCRLGLSATYRPGERAVHAAADLGVNYFFLFGIDTQMRSGLQHVLKRGRERYVIAAGACNYILGHGNLRKTLEKRLRQLNTDYIDVFHFLGVTKRRHFNSQVQDELLALREDGRVKGISISTHDRQFAGELASSGVLDSLMIRYNAAHRGAERDIFPHVAAHDPGIVSFTATRWQALLRRPRGWSGKIPTASQCYRFVLTNPHVDVCLTAPRNEHQLRENFAALSQGPLAEDEMRFMHGFGDAVYARQRWFM